MPILDPAFVAKFKRTDSPSRGHRVVGWIVKLLAFFGPSAVLAAAFKAALDDLAGQFNKQLEHLPGVSADVKPPHVEAHFDLWNGLGGLFSWGNGWPVAAIAVVILVAVLLFKNPNKETPTPAAPASTPTPPAGLPTTTD